MDHSEPASSHEAVLEHVAWMRQLAYELVRDTGAADDLVQETWLAFLRARPDTDRPLRPWLSRVVRNAAALRLRRGASRTARESDAASSELLPSAHELVERAEEQQRLSESVLALDEPYRAVILLRYYEGLTPQQIAKARGVPAATVRSQLHRGLAKLRERLDREHGGDRRAWVIMLQPLWSEADKSAAAASVSTGVMIGVGLVATALLWLGVSWALRDDRAPALEPENTVAQLADDVGVPTLLPRGSRVVVPPATPAEFAGEREWRLLDERTSEPLASYVLHVNGQDFRSDDAGRVTLPSNARSVVPIDNPGLAHEVVSGHYDRRGKRAIDRDAVLLPAASDVGDLRVTTGPTFRLRFTASTAVEPSALTARLLIDGSRREYGTPGPVQLAPVRAPDEANQTAWVRFADLPKGWEAPDREWRIEVRDDAGFQLGSTSLETVAPLTNTTVVDVELVSTGVVNGHIDGLPKDRLSKVTVALFAEVDQYAHSSSTVKLDANGNYVHRWQRPGAYSLEVQAPVQETWLSEIAVQAGEITTRDRVFEAVTPAGPIAGSVYSQSGAYQGQLLVYLLDQRGFVVDVFPTTWRRDAEGTLSAEFRFEHAPPGRLALDVFSLQDAVTFDFDGWELEAPREDLRLTLLDEEPAEDWVFAVVDARTGASIDEYEVEVNLGGVIRRYIAAPLRNGASGGASSKLSWTAIAGGLRWNRFESAAPLRRLPSDTQFTWFVLADGYAEWSGTESPFELDPSGTRRITRVRLEPE